jgi:hypothetical protein
MQALSTRAVSKHADPGFDLNLSAGNVWTGVDHMMYKVGDLDNKFILRLDA